MKKERMIAKRYANALFELAQEIDKLDEIERDMRLVTETIAGHDELRKIVGHRLIRKEVKKEIFKKVFAGQITEHTMSMLMLVISKGREMYLQEIYEAFYQTYLEAKNIVEVDVTSAVELTEEEVKLLEDKLKKELGKDIKFNFHLDPDLLGGVALRIGDQVIDGSVKTKLHKLEESLKKTKLKAQIV